MYMIYLIILSMLFIASYTAAVCVKQGGVPASISATFYKLDHKAWFLATMWLTAGLLMPAILEVSGEGTEWTAFLACGGMLLVGSAPNFREESDGRVHTAGAVLCIAGSQLWVALNSPWCLMAWAAYVIGTLVYMTTNEVTDDLRADFMDTRPMFWVEVAALVATYVSVFILL